MLQLNKKILPFVMVIIMFVGCSTKNAIITSAPKQIVYGDVEFVISATVGKKNFSIDSTYIFPTGEHYTLKSLKFFLSDVAVSKSTGQETKTKSEINRTGVYLMDFERGDATAAFKVPAGSYTDLRFVIGLPRELNHADPTNAPAPLDLGKSDMYWEWNSGYIFFLIEGHSPDLKNTLFHFAIGEDSRIMPFSFGNLFDIEPLIKVQEGKTTRIHLTLDINKIFINDDNSNYEFKSSESYIVHGGQNASALRNNILHSLVFTSSEIVK